MVSCRGGRNVILILAAALVLRFCAVWLLRGELTEDRDAYLAIARSIAAGRGYSSVPSGEPTAYRPPMYPVVLVPAVAVFGEAAGVGAVNLVTGILTVWITFRLGRRLGLGRGALLAAGLVAVDPLLLRYSAQPMTEVVAACLVVGCLAAGAAWQRRREEGTGAGQFSGGAEPGWAAVTGLLFGAGAVCRPTVWLAGALVAVWVGWRAFLRSRIRSRESRAGGGGRGERGNEFWRAALFCAVGIVIVVAPWTVRNWLVFGAPVVTTTHGGYTLLLGNNPVFYREVVEQPWGTIWSGESRARWYAGVEADLRGEQPPVRGEVARDRWMYARAWEHISEQPGTFLEACWLRFRRFWSISPLDASAGTVEQAWRRLCGTLGWGGGAAAAGTVAGIVEWTVAVFYAAVTVAMLVGLARLRRGEWRAWMPLVLVVVAFSLAHLVYWTNTRMRAPVVPVIALVAVRGVAGRRGGEDRQAGGRILSGQRL